MGDGRPCMGDGRPIYVAMNSPAAKQIIPGLEVQS